MIDTDAEFLMEVTDKTKADVKVGFRLTLIRSYVPENRLLNREELSSITRVKFACSKLPRSLRNTRKSSSPVRPWGPPTFSPVSNCVPPCSPQIQDLQHKQSLDQPQGFVFLRRSTF